jgi:hypothetical protein
MGAEVPLALPDPPSVGRWPAILAFTPSRALAEATAELLRRKELIARHSGVYHLAAGGHTSRYEFTRAINDIMKEVSGMPEGWANVRPITSDQYPFRRGDRGIRSPACKRSNGCSGWRCRGGTSSFDPS